MKVKKYDRSKVKEYAKRWAYLRNPRYYNFDPVGRRLHKFCFTMHLCWE